ncbi:phenylalanyl-tRNA synthetase beta subunit [Novosphingobium sp. CF614]|uniref:phenylalanine--tRNA ligase subunit beta n=1 Tax=Novosphingobium sp. CF614 TaxID=1884364 RepID=UPI0008EA87FF|nr:phenylalanine--tRNA ligase subunit beta [Novosphingobium sp. CF614]SFF74180.1 phenylalanyl-tRNA synthetase beta subunit [Novosphingobium sp. CF614]
MKFSLSWLKQYLETEATVEQVAARLNAIGLEVEGIEDPAAKLSGFRVARVLTAERHPQADKLQVLTVDTGEGDPLQVVCGAPNARAGLVGVLGLPGATVPANGLVLRKSAIRGVESNGMMCSTRELELGEDHDGIIELPADAPVGMAFAEYHGADPVIEVAVTPNRPDCMGIYGIARDLAAAGLGTLQPIGALDISGSYPCPVEIRTDDPEGCPAFYGRVIRGVRNGPSPQWLQDRLKSAGQRPISALVDATNYMMLAHGRPAHAYDLAKLNGPVVARRAKDGETVAALNEKTYTLDSGMTVIADDGGVHDIAGIMGGAHSGCGEETTDVLLEIAYFDPERIAATGRKLNLTSDARSRFERGIDPGFLDTGLAHLTELIQTLCGGEASEVMRAGTAPDRPRIVHFAPALVEKLGGVRVEPGEQKRILASLGFTVVGEEANWEEEWAVTVPGWRPDIDGAPDIVEEVVRIHGLDKVESVALPRADGVARPTATSAQKLERRVRRAAAARGLHEAVTWSFLPEADAEVFAPGNGGLWLLSNPISEDMKAMRPSLLPGLLSAARRNLDRGASSLRLFEVGRRYLRGEAGTSDERLTLGLVLAGEKTPRGWVTGKAAPFDAYDAKAEVLALLAEAGAPVEKLQVMIPDALGPGPQFHPGQSATLRLGPKNVLARFGMLHPQVAKHFDVEGPVAVAELYLDAIPGRKGAAGFARSHYAPPALQALTRDYAFLVPAGLPAGDLVRVVQGADKANIAAARLFDDFRGQGVPEGQKSLALEVTLQPLEKSYQEADLKAITDKVTAAAAKLGAVLRG